MEDLTVLDEGFTAAFWIALAIWALVWGGFTAWVADQKGRDPLAWFGLGAAFAVVALLAVGLAPSLPEVDREALRVIVEEDE